MIQLKIKVGHSPSDKPHKPRSYVQFHRKPRQGGKGVCYKKEKTSSQGV